MTGADVVKEFFYSALREVRDEVIINEEILVSVKFILLCLIPFCPYDVVLSR
jgi:hypothetical protein